MRCCKQEVLGLRDARQCSALCIASEADWGGGKSCAHVQRGAWANSGRLQLETAVCSWEQLHCRCIRIMLAMRSRVPETLVMPCRLSPRYHVSDALASTGNAVGAVMRRLARAVAAVAERHAAGAAKLFVLRRWRRLGQFVDFLEQNHFL